MRGIKVASTAAVAAAVIAMAFGAGSAAAAPTKLCEVNTSPCPAVYPGGTHFTVTGEFSISPLTGCEYTYKFENGASSGTPLLAKVTSFTFAHCGTLYTVSAVSLNWLFEITAIGSGNGTGEMVPGGGTTVGFEVNGNGEVGCKYTASHFPQSIAGGSLISASMVGLPKTAGTGCVNAVTVSMAGVSTPKFFVTN